jgi:hypothetical protein
MDAAIQDILERFEREWQTGKRPAIRSFVAALNEETDFANCCMS